MKNALHFVGFTHPAIAGDARYEYAVRIFGQPDIIHKHWDERAKAEVMDGDKVVFASEIDPEKVRMHAYDDSANQ